VAKKQKTPDEIRGEVTKLMVEALTKGTPPWRKPWANSPNVGAPCNFQSHRRYTGVNPLILMLMGMYYDVESKNWGTAGSWMQNVGVHPQGGSKATYITLFRMIPKKEDGKVVTNKKGEDVTFPMLRYFPVFNADQVKAPDVKAILDGRCESGRSSLVKALLGLKDRKKRVRVATKTELLEIAARHLLKADQAGIEKLTNQQIAEAIHTGIAARLLKYQVDLSTDVRNADPDFAPAEELLLASGADIRHGGSKAFYRPIGDFIKLPPKGSFDSMSDYYETAFHELGHWARGKGRVADLFEKRQHTYDFEELVAEISSCFLMLEVGVPMADKTMMSSQAYIKNWLKGMGNDPKFIFDAASQAGRVVDYLLGFIGKANAPYEDAAEQTRSAA
jgi:antirestriction protein ArdC